MTSVTLSQIITAIAVVAGVSVSIWMVIATLVSDSEERNEKHDKEKG